MAERLFALFCFSLAVAAWPIGTSAEEISPTQICILAAAFSIMLAVQAGALWIANRFANHWLVDVLLVVFITSNAYHFAFLTLEAKTVIRGWLAFGIGLGTGALLRAGMSRAAMLLFTLVFTAMSAGQYAYGRATMSDDAMLPNAARAPGTLPLKSDRNVYLISIESLHSPHAFRKLYGIDDAPHVTYLKAEGFRVLDRAYSVDTTTRQSYRRIMEFSKPLTSSRELNHVFRQGNATFASFQNAGYGVQFIYISNYMGLNHALVDHAYPGIGFYVCDNLRRNFFYFVCRKPVRALLNHAIFSVEGNVSVAKEIDHLKERTGIAAADSRPWLTISHIAFPGHTSGDHNYDDAAQVEEFRAMTRGRMPRVADHYRQIVAAIKEQDPDAVIVTFGDHGMGLTRGMSSAKPNESFSTDDYIEDRYGVMIGVYPADFCRNRIFEGSSTGTLVKSVIECLNGNDEPTADDLERSRSVVYLDETRTLDSIRVTP
jgi:hypothetical protein